MFKYRRRILTISLGCVGSAFFLWLSLHRVDYDSLVKAFASINLLFIGLSGFALAVGLLLRSIRWRVIAGAPSSSHSNFSRATNIGALSNLLIPGRAGEIVRIFTLARLSGSNLASPVASALIDRLIDVFVLIACTLALYFFMPLGKVLGRWFIYVALLATFAVIFIGLFGRFRYPGELLKSLANRWLRQWRLSPIIFLSELQGEINRLLDSWLSLELAGLVILILIVDYAAVSSILMAFQLSLPLPAALLLWVFLATGSALPSAPGYVGVYQIAAVFALSFFSVPASIAVAVATALQVVTLLVTFLMAGPGFVKFLKTPLSTK